MCQRVLLLRTSITGNQTLFAQLFPIRKNFIVCLFADTIHNIFDI
jgi:hypothetical protein